MLDSSTVEELKEYVKKQSSASGGFTDRAGKPDLYYSLFGFYISEALGLKEVLQSTGSFAITECKRSSPEGVHQQCAAILVAELTDDHQLVRELRIKIRRELSIRLKKQPEYGAFVTLLACYHTGDFLSVARISQNLKRLSAENSLPSTVIAALIILDKTFSRPVGSLTEKLDDFYDKSGGFRAVKAAPVPDLLSTAVALYALKYSGSDLKMIKPECLNFIDSHYIDGGFCGNLLDPDTDIEYTFYGLLALGSLAD